MTLAPQSLFLSSGNLLSYFYRFWKHGCIAMPILSHRVSKFCSNVFYCEINQLNYFQNVVKNVVALSTASCWYAVQTQNFLGSNTLTISSYKTFLPFFSYFFGGIEVIKILQASRIDKSIIVMFNCLMRIAIII